ncbi:MAG: hypothetical protein ACOC0V_00405, partial [Oceanicaulis sp.]
DQPAAAATPSNAVIARLRFERWIEFKRMHLGFVQTVHALSHGHSSSLALIRHAMLAEYEARRMRGAEPEGAPDLIAGEAMRQAVARCEAVYRRVNARAFDEKALAGLADEADPHLIALMLNMTTAPIDTADLAVLNAFEALTIEAPGAGGDDHARRFSREIRKAHARLRVWFAELAKRAGLA